MTSDPLPRSRLTSVARATIIVTAIYLLGIVLLIVDTDWTPILSIVLPILLLSVVAVIVLAIAAGRAGGSSRVAGVVCGCALLLPILVVVLMNVVPAAG